MKIKVFIVVKKGTPLLLFFQDLYKKAKQLAWS